MSTVVTSIEGGVATLTLNRPDALNALNAEISDALAAALRAVAVDQTVRCVVLTGAGRAFSSGADLADLQPFYERGERLDLATFLRERYHPIIETLMGMDKPIIAAVNGVAAGAGASLALACDIRVASEKARFMQAFVKVGLVTDSGGSHLLPRLVGVGKALELAMTGDIIDAAEALRIGLVNEVVPADELEKATARWASSFATGPTRAYGAIRKAIRYGANHTLAQTLEFEAELQTGLGQSADHVEAVTAFLEKREPRFEGR